MKCLRRDIVVSDEALRGVDSRISECLARRCEISGLGSPDAWPGMPPRIPPATVRFIQVTDPRDVFHET